MSYPTVLKCLKRDYGNPRVVSYLKLKNESTENRCNLVETEKICFNCLSNTHMINIRNTKRHCQVDNCQKRHHTLLHSEEMPVPSSPDQVDSNINNIIKKKYCLKHTCKLFL